jgi:RNA polymerase sigma factor (sigma-70 family)
VSTLDDLAAFCEREWPRLVGALSLYCADRGLAEELAQDALERACRKWARVRAAGSPGAYVHRIAINLANSRFRRQAAARRARARLGTDDVHEDRDVTSDLALRETVSRLPTRQKTALVLRYMADMTPEEVGEQMGCSAQAVRNLTHRAIATLRDELDDDLPLSMQEATDGS